LQQWEPYEFLRAATKIRMDDVCGQRISKQEGEMCVHENKEITAKTSDKVHAGVVVWHFPRRTSSI